VNFGAKVVIILETKEYFTYNLVVWLNFTWSFGSIPLGRLAQFHLVIWLNSTWSFGSIPLGRLAQFHLVIWLSSDLLFGRVSFCDLWRFLK